MGSEEARALSAQRRARQTHSSTTQHARIKAIFALFRRSRLHSSAPPPTAAPNKIIHAPVSASASASRVMDACARASYYALPVQSRSAHARSKFARGVDVTELRSVRARAMQPLYDRARCDFALEITSPITFRNAIDIIGHTLALATFYVETDDQALTDEVRLKVDSMDATQVCAIKLRVIFHGSVGAAGDAEASRLSFTLKLRMLLVLLKTMATTDTLHMYRLRGEDNLRLRSTGADTQEYELKTLAETYPPVAINDIVGAAFSVEFDVARLKMMTKVAHSVRADHLRFRIAHSVEGAIQLVVSCAGDDAQGVWEFCSDTTPLTRAAVDGTHDVTDDTSEQKSSPPTKKLAIAATSRSSLASATTYDATFPVSYIAGFVKAMDRATVIITLCEGHPLVIEYPLGLERSNIRFLLAPRVVS